jgi:serine/threonine-protein kinase
MSKIFTISEGLENLGAMRTGGQGSVYKAKRTGPIISAVKIIPTPIYSENIEDKNYRNFQNEVEKLKKVNEIPNPNVVKILNSGLTESGSFPFIEMEYIEGPDLEELLTPPHNPVFTIRETVKLAEQLANALAHCHRVGVKHGDIKSNNVKFNTATGNYILLDFGLAIMSDEQRRSSVRHAGAVEFMAPEQHDGEMFFQTDIYSYGIILYELLAGTVPFPLINKGENSRNSVMLAHMEKQVPDLLALRKNHLPEGWSDETKAMEMDVPDWLLQLISKCLEKQPDNRYANGSLLQEEFSQHSTRKPVGRTEPAVAMAVTLPEASDEDTNAGDAVRITKPIFYIMVLALVVLSLFAAYSVYLNDTNQKQIANYRSILDSAGREPVAEAAKPLPEDTISQIKPIITDTALLQTDTNVDSLQKEYEKQMAKPAATVETPPVAGNTKSSEPILESQGKKYRLPKSAIYFYDSPNSESAKRGVLGLWSNTKFSVTDQQNDFIYVTHTNNSGEVTRGWLKLSDLNELP